MELSHGQFWRIGTWTALVSFILPLSSISSFIIPNQQTAGHPGQQSSEDFKKVRVGPHLYFCLTINFQVGDAQLSLEKKEDIINFIRKADPGHPPLEVKVAAWSDFPYPDEGNREELDIWSQKLARRRLHSLVSYLRHRLHVLNISAFNMAERPKTFEKLFKTHSAQLKSSFINKDQEASPPAPEFRLIQESGGPSKAVLVAVIRYAP